MNTLIVRGSTGIAVFTRIPISRTTAFYKCSRDAFQAAVPSAPFDIPAFLQNIATHAQTHTGAIAQIIELDL